MDAIRLLRAPRMMAPATPLWRRPDFLKLWTGQTVSTFGSQVTLVSLPLTAALTVGATPTEMGLLGMAQFAPFLLFGLVAGAWVDRLRRRPILIGADLARAVVLSSVPLALFLGTLTVTHLYVVAFLTSSLGVFFTAAYQAYLPTIVPPRQLIEGNSKLEVSRSAARVLGPGLGGFLIQLVTAPLAIAFDALSFLGSAILLVAIRRQEESVRSPRQKHPFLSEIREGLHLVTRHPVLRALAIRTGLGNFFDSVLFSVYVLYLTRDLGLDPAHIGMIFAVLGGGALIGSLVCARVTCRLGFGRTMSLAGVTMGVGYAIVPLAGALPVVAALPVVTLALAVGAALLGLGSAVYNINLTSLRQAITPTQFLGRVSGTMQFLTWGTMPFGALLGGVLGEAIGVRPTITVAALGIQLATLSLLLPAVRASNVLQQRSRL